MKEAQLISLFVIVLCLALVGLVRPLRKSRIARNLSVIVVIAATGMGYWQWGSFTRWQIASRAQEKQLQVAQLMKSIKGPEALIAKLRAQLTDTPASAKGWYLLGRLYSTQGSLKLAVDAYAKAHRLQPEDVQFSVNYAQSLWEINQHKGNAAVRNILQNVLKNSPNQPDALALLAQEAYSNRAYEQAIGYWQQLLPLADAQSEEAALIRQAIAQAQSKLTNR